MTRPPSPGAVEPSPIAITPLSASQLSLVPSLTLPRALLAPLTPVRQASSKPSKILQASLISFNTPASPSESTIRPRRSSSNATTIRVANSNTTTVKPSSFARQRADDLHDYHRILQRLHLGGGSAETACPAELAVGIDEVGVEWCILCGKERDRGEMALREVVLPKQESASPHHMSIENREGETKHEKGKADDWKGRGEDDEAETGIWWVCRGECHAQNEDKGVGGIRPLNEYEL